MSGTRGDAETGPSDVQPPTKDDAHTGQGAPTDKAHQDAGDGTLAGSTPAGLTADELQEQANSGERDDGGTG